MNTINISKYLRFTLYYIAEGWVGAEEDHSLIFTVILMQVALQWNLDLRKPYYTKNSEYEMGFEEISFPFNKKTFKIRNESARRER